jgi:DNA-directed RNA polymerase specialized sigma24 family protein
MSTAGDHNQDENSTDPAGLAEALTDPVRRRSWLLAKALETQPLDQALELARTAEAFITGSPNREEATANPPHSDKPTDRASARDTKRSKKRTPLTLPSDQREQLLERLAAGTRNAEVASEFGLSIRQVQGIRMGSAREITRIRDRARDKR